MATNNLSAQNNSYSVRISGIAGLSVQVSPNRKKSYYLRYAHPHLEGKLPKIMLCNIDDAGLYGVKYKAVSILNLAL